MSTAPADSSWLKTNPEKKCNKLRLDALSIPHNVIKGVAMVLDTAKLKNGKSTKKPGMRGRDAARKLTLKVNILQGIHDRFLRDQVYRESQVAIGWTEQKCTEMDELAKQNHTHHLSTEEFKRYQEQWYLTLNKSGKNAPMRLRPDFRAAVSLKNRLHRESGEQVAEPVSPQQYRRWHSSSSDSWWDTSDWSWWSSY